MRKNMSWFARIYIVITVGFLALLVVASCVLWSVLDAYESTRPKYTAQEVFNNYFVEGDTKQLMGFCSFGNGFESEQTLSHALNEQLRDKELQYFSVSKDGVSQKYAVTADGVRVAYFTLAKDGQAQDYGFYGYSLSDVELFVPNNICKTVIVPEGYALTVNSKQVNDEYRTKSKIPHRTNEYLPKGEEGLYLNEYTITGFCAEPEIKVTDATGKEVPLTEDGETKVLSADFANDESLQQEFSQTVINIASIYTAVMSKDAPNSQLYQYIDKSSAFYKKLKTVDTWFWPHDGHKIKDTEASQFHRYSDDVFTCRVKLTQELYLKKTTEINKVDLILCMRKVGGRYLLYNAATNG